MRLFLSYSRDDKAYVYELWRALRDRAHHDAWIDQRMVPAGDWWETILRNIESCEAFVYLMTPKSVESIYCRAELTYALALNKPLLPVMIKPCDYPDHLKQRRIQYVTLTDSDSLGDALFIIAQALSELRVELMQGKFPPNPPPARPPEPMPAHQSVQVAEVFMLAEEATSENSFSLAEKLFQQVIDADPQGFGLAAAERLGEIRAERSRNADYLTIVQMVSNPVLKKGAAALWRVYVQKYGTDYDPNGIVAQFAAQVVVPPQSSSNIQPAPPPPVITTTKSRVLDILPPPFAWIEIPTGAVTLESGGYIKSNSVISVRAFTIAKYPVTNAQYQVFINAPDGYKDAYWWTYSPDAHAWRKENHIPQERSFPDDDHPCANVTWYESVAFTRWLSAKAGENIRLLSETEWQRAAQGDDNRIFQWGNDWDGLRCNNCIGKNWNKGATKSVREYEGAGDSPFGVVDLAGNVWEWTATDWIVGGENQLGSNVRVMRGGSWYAVNMDVFRTAYRNWEYPDTRLNRIGFRCARS